MNPDPPTDPPTPPVPPDLPKPPGGMPVSALPPVAEFARWLAEDPAGLAAFENFAENLSRSPGSELPPELRAAVQGFLAKRQEERSLAVVTEKLRALDAVVKQPAGSMRAEDRLRQARALVEAVTDGLLDVPEPHRTRFFQQLLPLRERLRALEGTGGA